MPDTLIMPFTHHVLIATTQIQISRLRTIKAKVFVTIRWDGKKIALNGVEGPRSNGDCRGSCGQIVGGDWSDYTAEPGIDLAKLRETWQRWHLNDMRAGTPAQEASLREMRAVPSATDSPFYDRARAWLAGRGLLIDNGYQYGTKWLHEDVPTDVLDYLRHLPDRSGDLPECWKQ